MLSLPIAFRRAIGGFAPVFSRPVWQHVQVLLTGAVLAPGPRTVTAMLRMMGRGTAPTLPTYHRVLTRAVWSPLTARRLLLRLLVAVFLPRGLVVFGLDDPSERRRGTQLTAQGIARKPVRSSHTPVVKASGLRWFGWLVRPPIAWAPRVWAWPLLTVRCPSARFSAQRGRRHHTVLERAWHSIRVVWRWWPDRARVFVAHSSVAALAWLALVARLPHIRGITRLRLDAALSAPPPHRALGTPGRPRLQGKRRPTLEAVVVDEKTPWSTLAVDDWYGAGPREVDVATATAVWSHTGKPPVALRWVLRHDPPECCTPQALVTPHLEQTCTQRLTWCVRRWMMAVTGEEARAHLGLAPQRQWHAQAIARPMLALVSLSSIMTLTAHLLIDQGATWVRSTAWSGNTRPTLSDALAWVRRQWWDHIHFSMSHQERCSSTNTLI